VNVIISSCQSPVLERDNPKFLQASLIETMIFLICCKKPSAMSDGIVRIQPVKENSPLYFKNLKNAVDL
jgi:hypothetical protein